MFAIENRYNLLNYLEKAIVSLCILFLSQRIDKKKFWQNHLGMNKFKESVLDLFPIRKKSQLLRKNPHKHFGKFSIEQCNFCPFVYHEKRTRDHHHQLLIGENMYIHTHTKMDEKSTQNTRVLLALMYMVTNVCI